MKGNIEWQESPEEMYLGNITHFSARGIQVSDVSTIPAEFIRPRQLVTQTIAGSTQIGNKCGYTIAAPANTIDVLPSCKIAVGLWTEDCSSTPITQKLFLQNKFLHNYT